MWWLLSLQSFIIPVTVFTDNIVTARLGIAFNQFLLLGLIPGTDIQITFSWFIVGAWLVFFVWLYKKAYPELIHSILKHRIPKGISDIDLQAL